MPDDTTASTEERQTMSLPINHIGIEDVPIYGCDHVMVSLMPTDGSCILQMFATIPPIPDLHGDPPKSVSRKCIGQFHLTPAHVQNLAKAIQEQLANPNEGETE